MAIGNRVQPLVANYDAPMTHITFVRHGQTHWNLEGRVQGWSDIPLDAKGRDQAQGAKSALRGIDFHAAFTSDLKRARETAEIILEGRAVELTPLADLREKNYGSWEGRYSDQLRAQFKLKPGDDWGDAEVTDDVRVRIQSALRTVYAACPEGHVLVVGHRGVAMHLQQFAGIARPVKLENCGVIRFDLGDDAVIACASRGSG